MWLLLVVLTLVPTLGMAGFAARQARASASAAEQAGIVARETEHAVQMMDLATAISQEHFSTYALARAEELEMPDAQASELVGTDLVARLRSTRLRTDRAIAAAPADRRHDEDIVAITAELATVREVADGPTLAAEVVQDSLQALSLRAESAARMHLGRASIGTGGSVDEDVASALHDLDAVVTLFRADDEQTNAVGRMYFEHLDETRARRDMNFSIALYRRQAELVQDSRLPLVRDTWDRVRNDPDMIRLDRFIDEVSTDSLAVQRGGLVAVTDHTLLAVARNDALTALTRAVGEAAVEAAADAERDAAQTHRTTIAASLAVGLVAAALAVVTSWSISRPLRLLARRALAITDGQVGASPVPARGPREVRIVAGALDEAAVNLGRVGEQAQALADGDLHNEVLLEPVEGALGRSVYASVEQLSESLREQEELRRRLGELARHDVLTGLPNRAGCLATADHALARARRTGTQIAVLALNLDGFKRVNELHGHAAGDAVLCRVAERALATVRAGDTVARIGGDQFVVIAEAVEGIDHAVVLGVRLIAVVSEPIEVDGRTVTVGASVGVALHQDAHEDGLALLDEAEEAVAGAKHAGGGRVEVIDDVLRRELADRSETEEALRLALATGELELHYQPVVDTVTGRVHGFEALARWDRPGHGMVPPMVFVPVAEASDLVVDLGRWVLAEATAQLAAWTGGTVDVDTHVAVNISGRHLVHPTIVDDVRQALQRSRLDPSRLVVEITETVLLTDLTIAVEHLRALRQLGVRIAIDDFGTGYTSIGQLRLLPVDILKIDRAFVSRLDHPSDRSLVELIIGVARTLGLSLVAEGVEDDDQLRTLQRLECDDVQGYLISRPLPVDDAAAWARSSSAATAAAQKA